MGDEPSEQRMLGDTAAAAMLEFQITVGDLPAVVLAAD